MSNRRFKEKLWQTDPHCYWCKKLTRLLCIPEIKGPAPNDLATLDHLRSRYDVRRFIKPQNGEKTKVLACYECNSKRSMIETSSLSKQELIKRGQGFSLNPRGKPIIIKGLNSIDDVIHLMREKLPDFDWYEKIKFQIETEKPCDTV